MSTTDQIQVGSLAVAKRISGVSDPGKMGVCDEVYQLAGQPGSSFLFKSGRYDGFSPGDIEMFLDPTGCVCEAVADDQFQNVMKRARDDQAGQFAPAFPHQMGRACCGDLTRTNRKWRSGGR